MTEGFFCVETLDFCAWKPVFSPLFRSSLFFAMTKRATGNDSLPRSSQKERQGATRSLPLYKKSKRSKGTLKSKQKALHSKKE